MQRDAPTSQSYVVFQIGENEFALPLFRIRQILSSEDLQELAGGEQGKAGIVMHRGRAIDVLDLAKRLAIAGRSYRQQSIIVLNEPSASRGILVDSAPIVTTIEARQIHPLPTLVRSPGDPYEGIAKLGEDRLAIVLDATRL